MDDEIVELFQKGLFLLGGDSEMSMNECKILRMFLAEGFYHFQDKNKSRNSKKDDRKWLYDQSEKYGVNA